MTRHSSRQQRRLRHVVSICFRNLEFRGRSSRQPRLLSVKNGDEPTITNATTLSPTNGKEVAPCVTLEDDEKDTRSSFQRSPRTFDFAEAALNRLSTGSGQLFLDFFPQSLSSFADMMDTYFTLSLLDNEDLYVSDTKHASRNPSWHLLPESIPSEKLADEKGKYRLTLWGRKSADSVEDPDGSREYRVISEWTLDFSSLEFVGTDLADHEKVFPANTPLFEFLDGFYTLAKAGNMEDAEESLPVKVDHQKVKGSYKLECINRIVAAQKEILLIQDSINTLQRSSEALASRKSKLTATERRAEILGRIAFIEKEMTARTQSIQSSRLKLKEMKEILAIRNRQLRESGPDRESTRHGLDLKQAELARTKLGCSKTCAHISFRQRRLIFDMKSIYPIELGLVGNLMSIRGIKLPNSEFSGFDDERISTGLGYTAHLIIMIATYLEVPLRYPINPMSSRSMILDRVSRQFPGSREFPLFLKGVDKLRFEYGVFLLNKDIEQLMNHVGMNVTNLRNTLSNLKALIDVVGEDAENQSEDDVYTDGGSLSSHTIRQEDYTDLSPLTSSSKLQYPISSSHGPDSNTAFTSENSLRILKPNRFDPRIDEDDEVDYSMGGNHLDEFIKQPSASIEAPNGLEKIRRSSDTTPRPLLFPMAVSSITSLTPGDFWPETQDVNLP